jgi:hypothetical protein
MMMQTRTAANVSAWPTRAATRALGDAGVGRIVGASAVAAST